MARMRLQTPAALRLVVAVSTCTHCGGRIPPRRVGTHVFCSERCFVRACWPRERRVETARG